MVQVHSKCSASLFVVLYLHSCAGYCAVSVVGGQGVIPSLLMKLE